MVRRLREKAVAERDVLDRKRRGFASENASLLHSGWGPVNDTERNSKQGRDAVDLS